MLDEVRNVAGSDGAYVPFLAAGASAVGEYHCSGCGYGVTIHGTLPQCPMCGGTTWEPVPWSPFTRARDEARAD